MGRGVNNFHAIIDSIRFSSEGTLGNQETMVSSRLHSNGVGASVDYRDFQLSAAA